MAFRKPGLKNGARRREVYEDRNARISILARGLASRPDTLQQTDHAPRSIKLLADGAGHTFLNAAASSGVADLGFFGRGVWIDMPQAFSASQPR